MNETQSIGVGSKVRFRADERASWSKGVWTVVEVRRDGSVYITGGTERLTYM